jgi:hypothetical protein
VEATERAEIAVLVGRDVTRSERERMPVYDLSVAYARVVSRIERDVVWRIQDNDAPGAEIDDECAYLVAVYFMSMGKRGRLSRSEPWDSQTGFSSSQAWTMYNLLKVLKQDGRIIVTEFARGQ